MSFHSVIYEGLKQRSPSVAASFLRDYKSFAVRRAAQTTDSFLLVGAYFFSVFSSDAALYHRELRCVTGNKVAHLWLEDFNNVIAESYIRDHDRISINTHGNSNLLITELGELLAEY